MNLIIEVLKNKVKALKYSLQKCVIVIISKKNNLLLGDNVTFHGIPYFTGYGRIEINNNTRINSGVKYNPIGGEKTCIFNTRRNGLIKIGKNVGISNSVFVSEKSIIVEDNVLIGGSCKFYDTDFHSVCIQDRLQVPDLGIKSYPIRIGQGSFIGAHSIILKGVSIGKNCVIGAGSVVTHSIPDDEIWAGNPARFIRRQNH